MCWAGDADPGFVYAHSYAATPDGTDLAVRVTIEEDGEAYLLSADKPATESERETYPEWSWDEADEACLTGIVVRFELDDPEAAAGLAPTSVDWSMWAGLSSTSEPGVDDLEVVVTVEAL